MTRQTRREFLRTLGAVAGLSVLSGGTGRGQASSGAKGRPNILFIMTDDHDPMP